MRNTLGVLLAGGAGERLFPLTRDRAKPAVPFAGQYRIIDITLSNCINSDLRHVYILTQYKALSLNRHIREGWGSVVANELGEFIEILPPMQRVSKSWYTGTADAVYQNIYSIGAEEPKYVLILSGDHIYKMNYALMMQQHCDSGADVTLATLPIKPEEVSAFGVVDVAQNGEVLGFLEKPKETNLRSPFNPEMVDASMGIYLFNTDVLLPELIKDAEDPNSKHDFGHNILPKLLGRFKVHAYNFVDENKQGCAVLARRGDAGGVLRGEHGCGRRCRRRSTCTTRAGRCGRGRTSIRRRSLCLGSRDARAWRSIRSSASGSIVSGAVVRSTRAVARCARELVCGCGLERDLFAREYRAALPDPARDY